MIPKNKDVQYWNCSVVFSSHAAKVGGMAPRELNNRLIFLVFFPVASDISSSSEKCSPFILSVTIALLIFDVVNSSYSFLWSCHPTSMFFVATREVILDRTHYTAYLNICPLPMLHSFLAVWCILLYNNPLLLYCSLVGITLIKWSPYLPLSCTGSSAHAVAIQ